MHMYILNSFMILISYHIIDAYVYIKFFSDISIWSYYIFSSCIVDFSFNFMKGTVKSIFLIIQFSFTLSSISHFLLAFLLSHSFLNSIFIIFSSLLLLQIRNRTPKCSPWFLEKEVRLEMGKMNNSTSIFHSSFSYFPLFYLPSSRSIFFLITSFRPSFFPSSELT